MKSIALKSNNSHVLEYLQQELENLNMDNIYYSKKKFKHYNNIIIHYTGNNDELFITKLSSLLSLLIVYELEDSILNQIIYKNYFYFSISERKIILNNCFNIMVDSKEYLKQKFNILQVSFKNILTENKNIFLNGYLNFRFSKYHNFLNSIVDEAVNTFIIEKEYKEFISLIKLYVNSQKSKINIVHVIYSKNYTLILDENKEIISHSKNNFNAKFLSDISFSTNDYTLNTLLDLIPEKIYIHLIDNVIDEFVNTLNLIFEKRIINCTDCNICNLYKNIIKTDIQKK
ncbi:MAG: putative sporulation protein YtxC [Clostridia bacterium]|nr:putative sporulation protein YtxC [Clostridia bacterium]